MVGFSVLLNLSILFICLRSSSSSFLHASFLTSSSTPEVLTTTSSKSIYDSSEEKTFVAIKPDAIQRNLMGEIIGRVERKGLKVVALKLIRPSLETISEHYHEHKNQFFFQDLVEFFLSGPIVVMVLEGINAIDIVRKLVGETQPEDAEAGTIRGDYCFGKGRNLIHASDSIENAIREIGLWFSNEEILSYSKTIDQWVKLQPRGSLALQNHVTSAENERHIR
jgi:nucleoside-diphosphate kinase